MLFSSNTLAWLKMMIRWTVYFSGHVQGVGFRYTACRIAQQYCVAGYVRNLDDGRVLLVIEGETEQLQAVVDHLTKDMSQFIRDKTISTSPSTGEYGIPNPGESGQVVVQR